MTWDLQVAGYPNWIKDTLFGVEGYWIRLDPNADLDLVWFGDISVTYDDGERVWSLGSLTGQQWAWVVENALVRTADPSPDSSNINSLAWRLSSDQGAQNIKIKILAMIDEDIDKLINRSVFKLPGTARITGLQAYSGNTEQAVKNPWIFTEEGIYEMQTHNNDLIVQVPLDELSTLASGDNGVAHCQNGTYLYFNLGPKIERYFNRTMDDVGLDRDTGLPVDRRGVVSALASYAGRVYAAITAGTDSGLSGVYVLKGESWHEVYRTPTDNFNVGTYTKANRIYDIEIQAIPGTAPDRLWISQGPIEIVSVPIDLNPSANSDMLYRFESHIITSWIYANMYDVQKTFKSIKVHADDLVQDEQWIEVFYQIDTDTTWTKIGNFYQSPSQERDIGDILPSAKRIRYKIYLRTNDKTKTPKLKAIVTEGVAFVPVKYQRSFVASLAEGEMDIDLEGDDNTEFTVQEKADALIGWANQGQYLQFECNFAIHDNKIVFIHPPSITPIMRIPDEGTEKHAIQLTVIDI